LDNLPTTLPYLNNPLFHEALPKEERIRSLKYPYNKVGAYGRLWQGITYKIQKLTTSKISFNLIVTANV
jgi:hypothetical protein